MHGDVIRFKKKREKRKKKRGKRKINNE